jgi:LacI family transcriptional regulator
LGVKEEDDLFCINGPPALGAMRAIVDAGLRIPQDIAVMGCGSFSYSDLFANSAFFR